MSRMNFICFLSLVSFGRLGWSDEPPTLTCQEGERQHQTLIEVNMSRLETDTAHCPSPTFQNLSLALMEMPFPSMCDRNEDGHWTLSDQDNLNYLTLSATFSSPELVVVAAELTTCVEDDEDASLESYELVTSAQRLLADPSLSWSATIGPSSSDDFGNRDNVISDMVPFTNKNLIATHISKFSHAEVWQINGNSTRYQFVIDGSVMSDTDDEHIYHEMLVHPALMAFGEPKNVLIIGGGEGATLREVLQNVNVHTVTMVDIDEGLVQFCRTHLFSMHRGSFNSSRVSLIFEDGAHFAKHSPSELFDVVIVDGLDFHDGSSPGDVLFGAAFYYNVHRVLSPSGVFVQYMSDVNRVAELHSAGFAQTLDLGVDIPSFLGEGARFTVANKKSHPPLQQRIQQQLTEEHSRHSWRHLNLTTFEESTAHTARRLKGYYFHKNYFHGDGRGSYEDDSESSPWIIGVTLRILIVLIVVCVVVYVCKPRFAPARARSQSFASPFLMQAPSMVQSPIPQQPQVPTRGNMDYGEPSPQC